MKLGARTLKTGLAIAIALYLTHLAGITYVTFAAISAVFAMQPSVKRSLKTLKDQTIGNLLGAGIAIGAFLTVGNNFVVIGIAAIILIAILNRFRLDSVIGLATVTLIVVMMTSEDSFMLYALLRFSSTMIGILTAFIVNTLFFPPRYEEKLYHVVDYATTEILKWIRASVRKNTEYPFLKKDLKWVKKQMEKMDFYYSLFSEEDVYFRKTRFQNLRKVVVYRQMISTTKAAYNLLKTIHNNENAFNNFPPELRILIRERLETLLSAHEQILLKFNGRVPAGSVNFIANNRSLRKEFMQSFFDEASTEENIKEDYLQSNSVIHIMSSILNYEEYLEHLNALVTSYKGNHWNPSSDISNIENVEQ
ncbi:hypothetical protein CKN80_01975 [Carnobacterium divergens]|uniref:FUSC family protein n=1 Tax=Carnobacterium divergens TaxID=2748 RepID=UPI001072E48F|nr:aromatic acid exporter family protein [Carnobacterium divergens]TFJ47533.1 hypothetical protein CKN79_01975 [Carnobacterium divergens]TFJ54573.1 hypothetical protein CKN80_01975 [Carnobacterium divergens]